MDKLKLNIAWYVQNLPQWRFEQILYNILNKVVDIQENQELDKEYFDPGKSVTKRQKYNFLLYNMMISYLSGDIEGETEDFIQHVDEGNDYFYEEPWNTEIRWNAILNGDE